MRLRTPIFAALALYLVQTGCRERPLPTVDPAPLGLWRVELTSPGGELPFFLEITRSDDHLSAIVTNGEEHVTTSNVRVDGSDLLVDFSAFNSRLRASVENGLLVGSLSVVRSGGARQMMPLRATKGATARFSRLDQRPETDVTGRWAVTFRQKNGIETPAVGEFAQTGEHVTGTFLTPTGDYRYLEGDMTGRRLRLSAFDGYHTFLFDAVAATDSTLRGDFWSGTQWHETWEASRNEDAALPDADALTFLKPGYSRFNFAFPDTAGNLVTLDDLRFDDKIAVISISASWCPNCHDEAAFWAPYYRQNRSRGIEVVALMFEHVPEFSEAVRQIREFARRHHIEYPLLVGGTSDKEAAHRMLPMLNHVMAYPTTLFVDRRGIVRKIHTGFAGPGTGKHYRELTKEFSDYVDFLLAEPVPSSDRTLPDPN